MPWFSKVLLAAGGLAAMPVAGQATVFLPLDDWAAPVVEHLIRAGVLSDPDPLSRPLTHGAVLAAIAAVDTTVVSATVRGTLRTLRRRLQPGSADPTYQLDLMIEGAGASQDNRDPLRATGDAWIGGRGFLDMRASMGPLVFSALPYVDSHLADDPEWPGDSATIDIPGRFTNVYIGLHTRYAQITFGSVARNWGLPEVDGLLVSGRPYTYDHLAIRLGSDRLRIESVLTQLDGFASALGPAINRFFVAHRVSFRPIRPLTFAIGAGVVWRGVGAGWDTHYLNPFKLPRVTAVDESVPDSANTAYLGDFRVELPRGMVLTGQLLMDDWDVSPSVRGLPDRFAGTLGLETPLGVGATGKVVLTGVSSLTYRTQQGPDFGFLRNGVGLGRNHSDYLRTSATVTLMPAPDLLIAPEVTWLRQGESDFDTAFPPFPSPDYPFLFVGVVQTTWRFATAARFALRERIDLEGHAGVHLVRNAGHVIGATETDFVAGARVHWRFFSGTWQ